MATWYNQSERTKKRWIFCYNNGIRSETNYECSNQNCKNALHSEFFLKYHKEYAYNNY